MRGQRTVILFIVFGLLLWVVLRTDRGESPSTESDQVLVRVSEIGTETIRITNENGDIHLRKNADHRWVMTAPIEDRADDAVITSMLRLLDPLEAIQKQTGSRADQITFRVDRPVATATFREPRGRQYLEQTLKIGRKNNAFDAYYVMVGSDTSLVGMVDPYVIERYLLSEPSAFRYRRIADFEIEKVKRLGVETREGRVLLERNAKRRWEVVSPVRTPADQAATNGLVRRMLDHRVERFIDDDVRDPAAYGLNAPVARVRAELDNGTTYSLWVGNDAGEEDVYASRGDVSRVFTISKGGREEFARSLFDLRRREVVPFEVGAVSRVSVRAGDDRFVAERSRSGEWHEIDTDGARHPLRAYTVEAGVKNLGVLRARSFDDSKEGARRHGLLEPEVVLSVTLADGTVETVHVNRRGEDATFAVQPDGPVGVAPGGVVDLLVGFTRTPPRVEAG